MAARLAASQEGLSSILKEVSKYAPQTGCNTTRSPKFLKRFLKDQPKKHTTIKSEY
jgi:hypothetical protein